MHRKGTFADHIHDLDRAEHYRDRISLAFHVEDLAHRTTGREDDFAFLKFVNMRSIGIKGPDQSVTAEERIAMATAAIVSDLAALERYERRALSSLRKKVRKLQEQ